MKLGGATLMFCLLFGVIVLMGASMKTMKEIGQALSMDSSWIDQGLGGDDLNLQVIESSLMSMVREGTSPSLKPGIYAIYNLTDEMKAAVENKSNHEQINLTDAWYQWLNCTPSADRQRFDATKYQADEQCTNLQTGFQFGGGDWNGTTQEWVDAHCWKNCTEVCDEEAKLAQEVYQVSCPSAPILCEKQWAPFEDNTDVRAHMAFLQDEFRQKMLLQENCTAGNGSNCTKDCTTYCPPEPNRTQSNCSSSVCQFEQAGCELQYDACAAYHACYTREEIDYYQTRNWTSSQEYSNKQEYRAILRIECLLNAFLASIDMNESLATGIDGCINNTYDISNQALFGNVSINHYNVSENPRKNCFADFPTANFSFNHFPGTVEWEMQYYSTYPPVFKNPDCSAHHSQCSNLSSLGVSS